MLKLTQEAIEEFNSVKETKRTDELVARVFVKGYGWGGPMLGITLDELKETDYNENFDGTTIVVDRELLEMFKGFKIDFQKNWFSKGFIVTPSEFGGGRC